MNKRTLALSLAVVLALFFGFYFFKSRALIAEQKLFQLQPQYQWGKLVAKQSDVPSEVVEVESDTPGTPLLDVFTAIAAQDASFWKRLDDWYWIITSACLLLAFSILYLRRSEEGKIEGPPQSFPVGDMESISELLATTRHRLRGEMRSLGKRAMYNLAIGGVISIGGFALLWNYVQQRDRQPSDWGMSLANFVPNLSLVIIFEFIAFFFLRMYRSTLAEIQYYQNEATTLEQRTIGLHLALAKEDKKLTALVVAAFLSTDRNQRLSKDATTVELEKEKVEAMVDSRVALAVERVIKAASPAAGKSADKAS